MKVGDIIDRSAVPAGAYVRGPTGFCEFRVGSLGYSCGYVHSPRLWYVDGGWEWADIQSNECVTIMALGITGEETAVDLLQMARRFEQEISK
jgi:hypothetical protein